MHQVLQDEQDYQHLVAQKSLRSRHRHHISTCLFYLEPPDKTFSTRPTSSSAAPHSCSSINSSNHCASPSTNISKTSIISTRDQSIKCHCWHEMSRQQMVANCNCCCSCNDSIEIQQQQQQQQQVSSGCGNSSSSIISSGSSSSSSSSSTNSKCCSCSTTTNCQHNRSHHHHHHHKHNNHNHNHNHNRCPSAMSSSSSGGTNKSSWISERLSANTTTEDDVKMSEQNDDSIKIVIVNGNSNSGGGGCSNGGGTSASQGSKLTGDGGSHQVARSGKKNKYHGKTICDQIERCELNERFVNLRECNSSSMVSNSGSNCNRNSACGQCKCSGSHKLSAEAHAPPTCRPSSHHNQQQHSNDCPLKSACNHSRSLDRYFGHQEYERGLINSKSGHSEEDDLSKGTNSATSKAGYTTCPGKLNTTESATSTTATATTTSTAKTNGEINSEIRDEQLVIRGTAQQRLQFNQPKPNNKGSNSETSSKDTSTLDAGSNQQGTPVSMITNATREPQVKVLYNCAIATTNNAGEIKHQVKRINDCSGISSGNHFCKNEELSEADKMTTCYGTTTNEHDTEDEDDGLAGDEDEEGRHSGEDGDYGGIDDDDDDDDDEVDCNDRIQCKQHEHRHRNSVLSSINENSQRSGRVRSKLVSLFNQHQPHHNRHLSHYNHHCRQQRQKLKSQPKETANEEEVIYQQIDEDSPNASPHLIYLAESNTNINNPVAFQNKSTHSNTSRVNNRRLITRSGSQCSSVSSVSTSTSSSTSTASSSNSCVQSDSRSNYSSAACLSGSRYNKCSRIIIEAEDFKEIRDLNDQNNNKIITDENNNSCDNYQDAYSAISQDLDQDEPPSVDSDLKVGDLSSANESVFVAPPPPPPPPPPPLPPSMTNKKLTRVSNQLQISIKQHQLKIGRLEDLTSGDDDTTTTTLSSSSSCLSDKRNNHCNRIEKKLANQKQSNNKRNPAILHASAGLPAFIPPQFSSPPKDGTNIKPSEYLKRMSSNSALATSSVSSNNSESSGIVTACGSSSTTSSFSTPVGSLSSSTGASLISRSSKASSSNSSSSSGSNSTNNALVRRFERSGKHHVIVGHNRFKSAPKRQFGELSRSQSTSALGKIDSSDTDSVSDYSSSGESRDENCSDEVDNESCINTNSSSGIALQQAKRDFMNANLMNDIRNKAIFFKAKAGQPGVDKDSSNESSGNNSNGGSFRNFKTPKIHTKDDSKFDNIFAATKADLIAELKESRGLDGINKMKENSRFSKEDIKKIVASMVPVFKPEDFVDKIAESEPNAPLWRIQMLAKKAAEKARKESEEKARQEIEEKRSSQVPAWKRQMLAKKAAERCRKDDLDKVRRESEEKRLNEMPIWRRQLAKIKMTASIGNVNNIGD